MLWEGDVDNDGEVAVSDLTMMAPALGIEHDDSYFVSHAPVTFEDIEAMPASSNGTAPSFHYDGGTGELTMTMAGTNIAALALTTPAPDSISAFSSTNSDWWNGYAGGRISWVDRNGAGMGGTDTTTIAMLPQYLSADDFGDFYVGFALGGGTRVTPTINFVEPPEDGFTAWASTFGLEGSEAEALASLMGDGIPNLMKYALGLDPTADSWDAVPAATLVADGPGEAMQLQFVRPANVVGVDVGAEYTTDFSDWETEGVQVTFEPLEGGETVRVTITIPVSGLAGTFFTRLISSEAAVQ